MLSLSIEDPIELNLRGRLPEMRNMKSFRMACLIVASLSSLPLAAEPRVEGLWDAVVVAGQAEIPFRFEIAQTGDRVQGFFFEGDKKIGSTSGSFVGGKLQLEYEFLNTTLAATFDGDKFEGTYFSHRKNGRTYGFKAHRFVPPAADASPAPQIAGNWDMERVGADATATKTSRLSWKLYLRQSGAEVSGSILRVDGDTGNLSGRWKGDTLVLSHFAGERPVLFEAKLLPDGTLDITYNGQSKCLAARTSEARAKGIPEPPDPTRYTSVKDPSEPFHFSFPDLDGKIVSDADARFHGKVVILAIGGTWCPNCRDEAPFLTELYKDFHARGLEIVGLNFEASGDPVEDKPRVVSFVKEFGVTYPMLLAGAIDDVQTKLPQLVNFGAYPTSIYLGRDGRVASVHAGFASAATGEEHVRLEAEVRKFIEQLLAQKQVQASSPQTSGN
jgi:thiol-disulfide isomerase/thioredoxin